jgi:hypothetical protein
VRLDHLLSKEHAPLWVTVRVAPIVVVFTSGIIDVPPHTWCAGRSGICRGRRGSGVGAHCWGSEESDPYTPQGSVALASAGVGRVSLIRIDQD